MNKTINLDMADTVTRYAHSSCDKLCVNTALPENPVPTMAYVPFQLDKTVYSSDMALMEGTLFPALNKPFCGRSVL